MKGASSFSGHGADAMKKLLLGTFPGELIHCFEVILFLLRVLNVGKLISR
jgi:hypothetical protein